MWPIFTSHSSRRCRYAVHIYAATWYTGLPLRSTHLRRYVVHGFAATQYTSGWSEIQRLELTRCCIDGMFHELLQQFLEYENRGKIIDEPVVGN